MIRSWLLAPVALIAFCLPTLAQSVNPVPGIRAEVRPVSYHFQVGQPVWIRFSIENFATEPITLSVPGTEPEIPLPEVGLPVAHVFSGGSTSGVVVTTEAGRRWEQPLGLHSSTRAPILMIAPHSSVGTTLDLREYFPSLRGAGRFRIAWRPYGGGVEAESVVVTVGTLKHAEIITDEGTMTIRFFYDSAPKHVDNFIELAQSGFYHRKTFHRLEPGYLLQGGCPRGDRTGIRLDGKRLQAEFNSRSMEKGTVAMALLHDDADSASCQFFICNTRQKEWDGRYSVFGQLVGEESFETLDRLMASPTDEFGRPMRALVMRTVRIVDAPVDELP